MDDVCETARTETQKKMKILHALLIVGLGQYVCNAEWMDALKMSQDSRVTFLGRHLVGDDAVSFDFQATGFRIGNVDTSQELEVNMDVGCDDVRFGVFSGDEEMLESEFKGINGNRTYKINATSSILTIRKITEPFGKKCGATKVYGANVAFSSKQYLQPMERAYFIDFYGDSDTAAYGVDGKKDETFSCLEHMSIYEDFSDGWVKGVFDRLNHSFEYSVQAVSGIGVVRNAVSFGTPTLSQESMPKLIHRSLQTVDSDDFKPSRSSADLIVIYLGSNDYTNLFWNPSAETFTNAYVKMANDVRAQYEKNTTIPLLHICGGETKPCDYVKDAASRLENSQYTDTFDLGITKAGCIGHRDRTQQSTLADKLAPIFGKYLQ